MLWLSYRKMYRFTVILGALILVESLAEEAVFVVWLGGVTPRWLERLAGLVVACVCARFGNGWYRAHIDRLIASARAAEPDEEARLRLLARKGGRSVWAAVAAVIAFFVAMMVVLVCWEMVVSLVAEGGADR